MPKLLSLNPMKVHPLARQDSAERGAAGIKDPADGEDKGLKVLDEGSLLGGLDGQGPVGPDVVDGHGGLLAKGKHEVGSNHQPRPAQPCMAVDGHLLLL